MCPEPARSTPKGERGRDRGPYQAMGKKRNKVDKRQATMELREKSPTAGLREVTVWFDGGCRPSNRGIAFGSWEAAADFGATALAKVSEQEFGPGTNNTAEWAALYEALRWLGSAGGNGGVSPGGVSLTVYTDSTVVSGRLRRKLNGRRTNAAGEGAARMEEWAERCMAFLRSYGRWTIEWRGRDHNVARFGH